MAQSNPISTSSTYKALGGKRALRQIAKDVQQRIAADAALSERIPASAAAGLREHVVEHWATALGGRGKDDEVARHAALKGLHLEESDLAELEVLLEESLRARGLPGSLASDLIEAFRAPPTAPISSTRPSVPTPPAQISIEPVLRPMQRCSIAPEASSRSQAAQLASVLESVPLPVICVDGKDRVSYANAATACLEGCLFDGAVEGIALDALPLDPAVRAVVRTPPDEARRFVQEVGDEILQITVGAIRDDHDQTTGAVLTVEVITERERRHREAARLQSMVENAPSSMMLCDRDLVVQYANPASRALLEQLAPHLRLEGEVVGSSIDVFHDQPERARAILADPANLPHVAQIPLGDEVIELHVSAITGRDDVFEGPMITWCIITDHVQEQARRDALLRAENQRAETLTARVGELLEVVERATRGDLTATVDGAGDDDLARMSRSLDGFLADLRESIGKIASRAQALGTASDELKETGARMRSNAETTAERATTASSASTQVTENIQTVATGAEQMSTSIREIAKSAAEAARVAGRGVQAAEVTNQTVAKLGDSSAEIGKVVKVITSVAEQTNLLALNATIEAARAGEAGKGFAVVANEVKELAKETARATEDIAHKIEAIQQDTSSAVQAIGEITEIIGQISDIQNTIASAVEEQTATTNEIARNVAAAAQGSSEIARNITDVASAAQDTTVGASESEQAASTLATMASELQALVARFQY